MNLDDPNGHVVNQAFGVDRFDQAGPIEQLLAESKPLDSMSAQLVMREAYEQTYGLFDHERFSEKRPLAIVAMHPKENPVAYSPLYRIFYKYRQLEVEKRWGLSIGEFLDYPREFVELMFHICEQEIKKEAPVVDQAVKEINRLQRERGG